ncbi:MAG: hypothetical protein EOP06_05840 [Proteobacteria bacterium]|nr:MAG: hypothetical protein EOP06_05840 [Pseudomonadota bacterium]
MFRSIFLNLSIQVCFLLGSTFAFAQTSSSVAAEPFEIAMREVSKLIPEQLLRAGHLSIGKTNLKVLLKELDSVQYVKARIPQLAQGRNYFRYDVPTRTVFVPQKGFSYDEAELSMVLLHEAMGALGYQDDGYEISASLSFLSIISQSKAINPSLNGLSPDIFLKDDKFQQPFGLDRRNLNPTQILGGARSRSGGVTGAGGGGDPHAVALKSVLAYLFLIEKSFGFDPQDIVWFLRSVRIETSGDRESDPNPECKLAFNLRVEVNGEKIRIDYPESCAQRFTVLRDHDLQIVMKMAEVISHFNSKRRGL